MLTMGTYKDDLEVFHNYQVENYAECYDRAMAKRSLNARSVSAQVAFASLLADVTTLTNSKKFLRAKKEGGSGWWDSRSEKQVEDMINAVKERGRLAKAKAKSQAHSGDIAPHVHPALLPMLGLSNTTGVRPMGHPAALTMTGAPAAMVDPSTLSLMVTCPVGWPVGVLEIRAHATNATENE